MEVPGSDLKKPTKMAECSSTFLALVSEKEEDIEVINGCRAKGV